MFELGHRRGVGIVDAMSGMTLSDSRYDRLCVDTSGALLWHRMDNTIAVSSGPHSAGHALADVKERYGLTSFRYGVVIECNECQVLRFDLDLAPAVEPDRKARERCMCDAVAL